MRLPNAHLCTVSREKIVGYLLDPAHRYGASKERFFTDFGFCSKEWEVFAAALRRHGRRYHVAKVKQAGFGPRYEVDGELEAPDGRQPRVRTVWQVDEGETAPRLITAHPLEVS